MEQPTHSHSPGSNRPDAVIFPRPSSGDLSGDAKESAVEVAEQHLQCGPHELAWVRDQVRYLFATRDPGDSENFPADHEMSGKPRYYWVELDDGVKIGWRIDG